MRLKNSLKNSMIGLLSQLINVILNFINRTIFIYILGVEYLGINGLFVNILSLLSLAELGVGSAIVYHMYQPLAKKDYSKIKSLMNLYSRSYKVIGVIIGIIGIGIIPFLDKIVKDNHNVEHLTIIYLLFLINSVVSYFYSYKISIISADQKNYIVTINQQKYLVLQSAVQIIILALTKSYILYLAIQISFTLLFNISISRKADNLYPYLKEKEVDKLTVLEKQTIFKHVLAMMSHKVGGVVVNGTDNILISSFIGVYWVGIYSNYIMITSIVNRFIDQIFTAITASIGNLNVLESKEKSYEIYVKILFVNFWIYGFCVTSLFVLINPFIDIWLGKDYVMPEVIIFLIITNFYISGMRKATIAYNTTLGLFWNDRYKPWIEAIINVIASIFLLNKLGLAGVLLGTLLSTICTSLWVDPYILFKYGFKIQLYKYFKSYFIYLIATIVSCIISKYISSFIIGNEYFVFITKMFICLIIPNIIFCMIFVKSNEFKYFKSIVKNILVKKL